MEYKKVDKCTSRDEPRQSNILFQGKVEKHNLSKITTKSKNSSLLESTNIENIETKRESKNNREELKFNGSSKISQLPSDTNKDSNFEYEEEWDIDGIPELLSELDADIENSLQTDEDSKYEATKNPINIKQEFPKTSQPKYCEKSKNLKNVNLTESGTLLELTSIQNDFEKGISTSKFAGFSKGGHLISNTINAHSSSKICRNVVQQFKETKDFKEQSCSVSMSSQAGNNGNTGIIVSGTLSSTCGQSNSGSSSSIKPNNKMSIDHQATLDKGLKMKIKRTKPGTKSSEAKHEIVKASEQQQNGLVGTGSNICSTGQEEITGLLSNQSSLFNSQNSNVGISNSQGNSNSSGNKKNVGGLNSQNIASSNSGNISLNNTVSTGNSVTQPISQGTKRGSSGHRRDKTKEKSSHSNRTTTEKNSSVSVEKEPIEKCFCNGADSNVSACCNNSCIRKTENNTPTQRLPAKSGCSSISVVPPGVFTPSSDPTSSAAVSNLLPVTSAISSAISTQTVSSCVNANTPGPPSKDTSITNSANVKISSHIAAQLAAAAASNNSSNALSSSAFLNADINLSGSSAQSQTVKQISPCQSIATPVTSKKIMPTSSTIGTEKSISISNIKNDNSESPPPKRAKHADNDSTGSSINKEMVDICVGTSVGTITEPDCLGPCEPGTSVTLEGIVWHETEGGVLVVNVTWRGKTYVGTLLDCTRHDWAPPRFCDSPTEDLDTRTTKGRGKRNRATTTPDLSNFTETRSSIYFSHSHVHSKLRNGSTKGGRVTSRTTGVAPLEKICSGSSVSSGNNGLTPSSSPTAFLPPRADKRKSKDESPPPASSDNEVANSISINTGSSSVAIGCSSGTSQPQSLINPVTGLNVQISAKKCKSSSSPCAISPVLLECPENDCSKKYKHVNGLRYHQSHAHGNTSLLDEDSMAEIEGHITPQPSPLPSTPPPSLTPNPSDLIPNNQTAISSPQHPTASISEDCNKNKFNDGANMCQQLETEEKHFAAETVSSSSCEDLSTSTISSSIISTLPPSSENAPILKDCSEQKKQTVEMAENAKINTVNVFSLDTNNQAILQTASAKPGVLRYGQAESKNNKGSCSTPPKSPNEVPLQLESAESDSSKKCLIDNQELNNVAFCTESGDNTIHLQQNQHNIATNKTSSDNTNATKSKKERNILNNDYESDKPNTCNMLSREDVQSPAYSDISDDSAPINEIDHLDKQDLSKNSNLAKKSQNIELTASTNCPSSQTNISSTLNNYGVYQFYQQQQFLIPSSPVEQPQQSAKTTLNSAMITPSLPQHSSVSELSSKKDTLELLSKGNQPPANQHGPEINKDSNRTVYIPGGQCNSELPNVPSNGANSVNSTTPSKPVSHFYAFNYMPSNYSFNVDHNFGSDSPMTSSEDMTKINRQSEVESPNEQTQQQHNTVVYKDDRSKEEISPLEEPKSLSHQVSLKQLVKSDTMGKPDFIKQESLCNQMAQIPQHIQVQNKDHQGLGVYANMYQRHPMTLPSQPLTRDEELRRYYIFSDQHRRQNSSSHVMNQQMQNVSGNLLCKEDSASSQQHAIQNQSQMKIKGNVTSNINKPTVSSNTSKDSPKHKQDEEIKMIKQEGQKPTMETQGPPPPPTSQYFLHPSFITSSPFGFDPSHPMYRNVLMPATSPYNTPSYHLPPMARFHAPEDLSRNTGTKALDALHHAANQYYTTHKIHELSERALKSPSNSNTSNAPGPIKISGSSPNIVSTQQSNIGSHSAQNQSSNVNQLPHNLASQTLNIANKIDAPGQKPLGSGPGVSGTNLNEPQKSQATINAPVASSCGSGNSSNNSCTTINVGNGSDSRSPPPQRHVHTHHHTHVGLGYPMYPAPYGAAVLASQQAAAVAVINPFPGGPNK